MKKSTAALRAKAVAQLLDFLSEYYQTHGRVPGNVLSARFGKVFTELGGFAEVVKELREDGSLQVTMNRRGSKTYYPAGVEIEEAAFSDGEKLISSG